MNCPIWLSTNQDTIAIPHSWQALVTEEKSRLNKVAFYDGHPKDLAQLKPSSDKEFKIFRIATWQFFYSKKSDRYWISCLYHETHIRLVKTIPFGTKVCKVTYGNQFHNGIEQVKCE